MNGQIDYFSYELCKERLFERDEVVFLGELYCRKMAYTMREYINGLGYSKKIIVAEREKIPRRIEFGESLKHLEFPYGVYTFIYGYGYGIRVFIDRVNEPKYEDISKQETYVKLLSDKEFGIECKIITDKDGRVYAVLEFKKEVLVAFGKNKYPTLILPEHIAYVVD